MKALRRLLRRKTAIFGLAFFILILIVSIFAPLIAPHSPTAQNLPMRSTPPAFLEGGTWEYPLGTDNLGRDILSRVIYGSRISLAVSISAVIISLIVGTILGAMSGYYGGLVDNIIMRIAEVQLSFPFVLLAIAIIAIMGVSTFNLILVFAIGNWPLYARTVRSITLYTKELSFVEGARARGAGDLRIIFRHILPETITPVVVVSTLSLGTLITIEATLSFLGMGVPPPAPSWGRMLSEGRSYMHSAWWIIAAPGAFMTLTVLSINFFGDGLRDALDPRLKV